MEWDDRAFADHGLLPPQARIPIPYGAQDVASILTATLAASPDAEAIVGRHARHTYRELEGKVRAAVAWLRSEGVRSGDRIAASIGNHPEIAIAFLASQRIGAIWVGLNVSYSGAERAFMLRDSGARLLIAEPRVLEQLGPRAELPDLTRMVACEPNRQGGEFGEMLARHQGAPSDIAPIDPWAPAALGYTSGTTGFPKGVVHSQHNMALVAAVRRDASGFGRRHGIATPLTILNLMIVGPVSAFARGSSVICIERLFAPEIADWVKRERIDSLNSAPAVLYDMLTRSDIDRESLRSLHAPGIGSAHVPEAQRQLYSDFFGGMTFAYGLTEAPTAVASTKIGLASPTGSVGKPFEHLSVELRDSEDRKLSPGQVGEICIGPRQEGEWAGVYTPMLGYWCQPEATAAALRDGLLHTGDLGELDEAGELYVRGRLKDVIVRGGANIYPAEVERVISQDDAVLHCAVTGRPDERLGETVAAFVQLKNLGQDRGKMATALRDRCLTELSKNKVPVDWIFVDDMPRNQMNKIVKQALKDRHFAAGPADPE